MKSLINGEVNTQKMKGGNTEFLVNSLLNLVCNYPYVACQAQKKDLRKQNSVKWFEFMVAPTMRIIFSVMMVDGHPYAPSTPSKGTDRHLIPGQSVCLFTLLTSILRTLNQLLRLMEQPALQC